MNNGNRNFFLFFYNYCKFDLVFTYIKVACALCAPPLSGMVRLSCGYLGQKAYSVFYTSYYFIHSSNFFF